MSKNYMNEVNFWSVIFQSSPKHEKCLSEINGILVYQIKREIGIFVKDLLQAKYVFFSRELSDILTAISQYTIQLGLEVWFGEF